MASSAAVSKSLERKKQVMVGELPSDFLRLNPVTSVQQQQLSADEQTALMLQQQLTGSFLPVNSVGRLNLTIAQAKLNKNYGVTRMDPYCRIRIGHTIYETHTDQNGAKNPRWNKVIHSFLPVGVNSFYLEIFDECAFTVDERIAWGHFVIPDSVFRGETIDDWYPLSGRQGDEKEGMINLVMNLTPISSTPSVVCPTPMVMVPSPMYGAPYYPPGVTPQQTMQPQTSPTPQVQTIPYTEDDVRQLQEMFPSVELDVIRSIMDANRGSKEAAITSLLQITNES